MAGAATNPCYYGIFADYLYIVCARRLVSRRATLAPAKIRRVPILCISDCTRLPGLLYRLSHRAGEGPAFSSAGPAAHSTPGLVAVPLHANSSGSFRIGPL